MNIHKFLFLPLLLTAATIMADPVIRVVQSGAEDQWNYIGNAAANKAINGDGTVSIKGTVDLFAWYTR